MTGQPSDAAVTSSYEAWGGARRAIVFASFFTLLIAWILIPSARNPRVHGTGQLIEGVASLAFWLLLIGWTWYWILSAVQRLELTADTLRWRSVMRRHEVPLTELRRVRPRGRKGRVEVIEFAGRRPIKVGVRDGLAEFAADIKAAAPQVEVRFADRPGGYRPMA